ncbi:MAG: hypothetical protein WDZ53_03925 [Balneolales bacterium]
MKHITTIDEYLAALALAINTQDKQAISDLSNCNGIDWTHFSQEMLDQVDDLFDSVSYLFHD